MCVYSQSPDSMVGRGVTLPSSGPAFPPWCLQMRMWKVLCAKRNGVSVVRQRATPASSSPALQPGVSEAGQEPRGEMASPRPPQEAPGCKSPESPSGWEHISLDQSLYSGLAVGL